jgi:hypothetical protein
VENQDVGVSELQAGLLALANAPAVERLAVEEDGDGSEQESEFDDAEDLEGSITKASQKQGAALKADLIEVMREVSKADVDESGSFLKQDTKDDVEEAAHTALGELLESDDEGGGTKEAEFQPDDRVFYRNSKGEPRLGEVRKVISGGKRAVLELDHRVRARGEKAKPKTKWTADLMKEADAESMQTQPVLGGKTFHENVLVQRTKKKEKKGRQNNTLVGRVIGNHRRLVASIDAKKYQPCQGFDQFSYKEGTVVPAGCKVVEHVTVVWDTARIEPNIPVEELELAPGA